MRDSETRIIAKPKLSARLKRLACVQDIPVPVELEKQAKKLREDSLKDRLSRKEVLLNKMVKPKPEGSKSTLFLGVSHVQSFEPEKGSVSIRGNGKAGDVDGGGYQGLGG